MKILIAFYSRYGSTARLAEAIAEGVREVPGVEAALRRAPELAPADVIARDKGWQAAHQRLASLYPEAQVQDVAEADGIIIGSANRFGNMAAEMKLFIDQWGPLWGRGALVGKPGAVFTTNSTAHSGKESTLLTMVIPLLHMGMLIVGVPPTVPETAVAGSYYGATATTGQRGQEAITPNDLTVARALGQRVAEIAAQLARGKSS